MTTTATNVLATVRRPYAGVQMEGPMARWYARITRDRRDHRAIADSVAALLPAGSDVLEVAPGPGYLSVALAQAGLHVSAVDISRSFVQIAAANARTAGVSLDVRHGDVAHLPFAADTFDCVVCVAAFKNFPDPVRALDEIHLVLRPAGRAGIYDMRKDAPTAAIDQEIHDMHLPPPTAFVTRQIFRFGLLREAYTRPRLQ